VKGLILAAGRGTRLRPLTFTRPKPVIRVAGRPIIAYGVEKLKRAGIEEIGVVVSPKTEEEVKNALAEAFPGEEFTLIVQENPLGLAHAVATARDWLGEEDFILYLGDNLMEDGVERLKSFFEARRPAAALALIPVDNPSQFGVAEVEGERVVRLLEKPKDPPSRLAVAGVYALSPAIHEAIADLSPSARGEYEITDALEALIEAGKEVLWQELTGWWKDAGRPDDLLAANRLILESQSPRLEGELENSQVEGAVVVEPGARVKNSRLLGPLYVGKGAVVEDAYLGPYTSLGPRAVVKDAEVEDSVLEAEAVLEGVRLHGSLLGVGAEVVKKNGRPKAPRLILGDLSRVEVPS